MNVALVMNAVKAVMHHKGALHIQHIQQHARDKQAFIPLRSSSVFEMLCNAGLFILMPNSAMTPSHSEKSV